MANVHGVAAQASLDLPTPVVAGGVVITTMSTGDGAQHVRRPKRFHNSLALGVVGTQTVDGFS
jgi:hypothetical protein